MFGPSSLESDYFGPAFAYIRILLQFWATLREGKFIKGHYSGLKVGLQLEAIGEERLHH